MVVKVIIGIILIPLFFLNIIGPLIIKKLQKLPARVKFEPYVEQEFLLKCSEAFNRLDENIRSLGFEYLGSSYMADSHTETNFSLYSNKDDLTCAMVVTMVNNLKEITYMEFSQLYADGSMLDVTNADEVPVYPRMDIKITARYPEVKNALELYKRFKVLRKSLKNSEHAIPYNKESGFKVVQDFIAIESDILVKKGYCAQEIDDEGKRQLTLKGAYLTTWRSVFPGRIIQGFFDKKYSNKLLDNA
jgi:hypothetical protein